MPFVDLLHFKNNSTDYMSQKMAEKSAEKNPKIPSIWGKSPKIPRKIAGIF
jgi:hypothetical protein